MNFELPPPVSTWNGKRWIVDLDLDSGQPPPFESSTHLAWAASGELRVLELQPGLELSYGRNRPYKIGNKILANKVIPKTFDRSIDVAVRFGPDRCVTLECADLRALAEAVDAQRIRFLTLETLQEAFATREEQWVLTIPEGHLPAMQQGLGLSSGTDEPPIRLDIRWRWCGRGLAYFVHDPPRVTRVPDGLISANRHRAMGVVLDSRAPDGARIHAGGSSWGLELLPRDEPFAPESDSEWCYLFDLDGEPVSVRAAVQRLNRGVHFSAPGFSEVGVSAPPSIALPHRYHAKAGVTSLEPSVDARTVPVWDYGPATWLYPAPTERDGKYIVYDVKAKELRDSRQSPLRTGQLPVHQDPPKDVIAQAFFKPVVKPNPSDAYGVFVQATRIPRGRWTVAAGVSRQDQGVLLSWRGFVDMASVRLLSDNNGARHAILFENGFALTRARWFAAPFAGLAMREDLDWWASLHRQDAAVTLDGDSEWRVSGQWIEVDLSKDQAIRRRAINIPRRFTRRVALTGDHLDGAAPILELGQEATPRFAGWLADTNHSIDLHPGVFLVGDPRWKDEYRLGDADSLDALPAQIRRTAAVARATPSVGHGRLDDTSWLWTLEDNGTQSLLIRVDAELTGICIFQAS